MMATVGGISTQYKHMFTSLDTLPRRNHGAPDQKVRMYKEMKLVLHTEESMMLWSELEFESANLSI